MSRFGNVEPRDYATYLMIAFDDLRYGGRYYCNLHFTPSGELLRWQRHQGYGFAALTIPEAGVPEGGVDFALAKLAEYRLTGNVSPS